MIHFLKLQFRFKRIDEEFLEQLVTDGKITSEQKFEIIG